MKSFNQIKYLKLVSIIVFVIITFSNDKMHVPFGLILINSVVFAFVDFYKAIIPLLTLFGVSAILITKGRNIENKVLIVVSYIVTYVFLIKIILDKQLHTFTDDQLYFYISSIIYLIISFIVLFNVLFCHKTEKY